MQINCCVKLYSAISYFICSFFDFVVSKLRLSLCVYFRFSLNNQIIYNNFYFLLNLIIMEFPDLGEHCSEETCKQLDFLPVKCDACLKYFCGNHMSYGAHNCPLAYKKDQRVPLCPLCNNAIPVDRGTLPDIAVNQHIENNCHIKKKAFTNKCSVKGCRVKEFVPVICRDCQKNYCFRHRHAPDHFCSGQGGNIGENTRNSGTRNGTFMSSVHGGLNEDEALARALQISLNECTSNAARIRNNRDNGFGQNCTLC